MKKVFLLNKTNPSLRSRGAEALFVAELHKAVAKKPYVTDWEVYTSLGLGYSADSYEVLQEGKNSPKRVPSSRVIE